MQNKIHWLSVGLGYSTLFLFGIADNLRGPLFPEVLLGLQLTDTQGALLWASTSLFGFVASLLSVRLLQVTDLLGGLKLSLLAMSVGHGLMALSPNFFIALISAMVFGVSLGLLGLLQNLLVLRSGPPQIMARLQAGLHSNYAAASLLTPLMLNAILVVSPGWRSGYGACAVLTLVCFFALFFLRTEQLHIQGVNLVPAKKADRKSHGRALYFSLIMACYVITEIMVSSRIALYLRREAGFDFNQGSLATTAFFAAMFAGRIGFVFVKMKLNLKRQMAISLALTVVVLLLGLFYQPLLLALSGLTMAPFFPLAMSYLGEKFPGQLAFATAYAISVDGVMMVIMHLFVGLISDSSGIHRALMLGPAACAISLFLLIFDYKVFAHEKS